MAIEKSSIHEDKRTVFSTHLILVPLVEKNQKHTDFSEKWTVFRLILKGFRPEMNSSIQRRIFLLKYQS